MPQETQPVNESTPQSGGRFNAQTLDTLLQTGVQIAGGIAAQRAASGKSADRQQRIAACGRRPAIGKAKKAEYDKCVANLKQGTSNSGDSYIPPQEEAGSGSNTTRNIIIGVVALLVLVGGFFAVRKIMKNK